MLASAYTLEVEFDKQSFQGHGFPTRVKIQNIEIEKSKVRVKGIYYFDEQEIPFDSRELPQIKDEKRYIVNIAQEGLEGPCESNGFRKISLEFDKEEELNTATVNLSGLIYIRNEDCSFNYESAFISYSNSFL